ncbi:MAG TPA: primosomal protein N' [Anaerolineaceae bacterium]|nr:primosomal protein N' [Anaerolineaceae bacterium]
MTAYVEVAVNIPHVAGLFDYRVPADLSLQVKPGCLVIVPFGQQMVQGVVTRLLDTPRIAITRPVEVLVEPDPVVTPAQLELAQWLAHETLSGVGVCLDLMLPPGISQRSDTLYTLNPGVEIDETGRSSLQQRLVKVLQEKGPQRAAQLEAPFRRVNWRAAMLALIRRGAVTGQAVLLPPKVRPKTVRTVQLACPPQEAQHRWEELGRAGSDALKRRQAVLAQLLKEPWPVDVTWIYAASGAKLVDLTHLADLGLVALGEDEVWRDPLEQVTVVQSDPPELTPDQRAVWEQVQAGLCAGEPQPHVLFGVTGSGKTEIYLRAVDAVLRIGKQAIVLVPEIALTPQTVRRFLSRFPGQVGLIHSRLSDGERYDTWRRARAGLINVVVGPRSALFAPLPNPGLIVIDEVHEDSYAQSDQEPRYNAVTAAIEYARLTGSLLLLGSATPDVELMHRAVRSRWPVVKLPARIYAHGAAVARQMEALGRAPTALHQEGAAATLPLPPVQIVDMRQELASGNRSIFSQDLQRSLSKVLENHEQAILYLNRRGSATYVFCRTCGQTLACPRCDLPLTFHTGGQALVCHTCNYRRQMPRRCPACNSDQIRQYGAGTEKVEALVRDLYPEARVLRWDAETTRAKGAHDTLLGAFIQRRADILVGTQMLAKGLDLPLVTLVGVVLADVGLYLPDFRAGERTFQLLTQVAGRAGRSPLGGKVILQTFQPEHYAVRAAAAQDFRQ